MSGVWVERDGETDESMRGSKEHGAFMEEGEGGIAAEAASFTREHPKRLRRNVPVRYGQ